MSEATVMKECCEKIVEKIKDAKKDSKEADEYLYAAKVLKIYAENMLILPVSALESYHIKKDNGVNYNSYLKCLGEDVIENFISGGLGYKYDDNNGKKCWSLKGKPTSKQRNAAIEALNQLKPILNEGDEVIEKEEDDEEDNDEENKKNGDVENHVNNEEEPPSDDNSSYHGDDDNNSNPSRKGTDSSTNGSFSAGNTNLSGGSTIPDTDESIFLSMKADPPFQKKNESFNNSIDAEQPDAKKEEDDLDKKKEALQIEQGNGTCSKCQGQLKAGLCEKCRRCFHCNDDGFCTTCLRDFLNKHWQCYQCLNSFEFEKECDECLICEECALAMKLEKACCLKCGKELRKSIY